MAAHRRQDHSLTLSEARTLPGCKQTPPERGGSYPSQVASDRSALEFSTRLLRANSLWTGAAGAPPGQILG